MEFTTAVFAYNCMRLTKYHTIVCDPRNCTLLYVFRGCGRRAVQSDTDGLQDGTTVQLCGAANGAGGGTGFDAPFRAQLVADLRLGREALAKGLNRGSRRVGGSARTRCQSQGRPDQ